MGVINAVLNLDTSIGIVYKNTDYPLSFSVQRGIETNATKDYIMTNLGTLGEGELFSGIVDKTKWVEINSISTFTLDDENEALSIKGTYKLGYKYKITIEESGDIIKDYDSEFIYDDFKDFTIIIPHEKITSALNPYNIVVTILQEDGSTITSKKPILLADKPPTVVVLVRNNTVYAQIGDPDSGDLVKYNIYVNGEKLFPIGDIEYSEYIQPTVITFAIPRNKIKFNAYNQVVVNVVDNWGLSARGTNDFVGTFVGLMFCDENEEYYTNDIGELLKYLDFGIIQAGSPSEIKTVYIKNTYDYDIKDIVITVNEETVPPLNIVELDTSYSPFNGYNSITIPDVLSHNQKIPFYIRIRPHIESVGGGIVEIIAEATPVE